MEGKNLTRRIKEQKALDSVLSRVTLLFFFFFFSIAGMMLSELIMVHYNHICCRNEEAFTAGRPPHHHHRPYSTNKQSINRLKNVMALSAPSSSLVLLLLCLYLIWLITGLEQPCCTAAIHSDGGEQRWPFLLTMSTDAVSRMPLWSRSAFIPCFLLNVNKCHEKTKNQCVSFESGEVAGFCAGGWQGWRLSLLSQE